MKLAVFLHVLGVVVWVGGMFFAWVCLRPVAASLLEPPQRLALWVGVFGRFFPWVWGSVAAILATGLHMLAQLGWMRAPLHALLMFALGLAMMAIFAHVFFAPFGRLKRAVAALDWKTGGAALGQIRRLVGINLALGIATVAVATVGAALL